ncbi:hypothetical protein EMIT079MI2_250012 [Bacillus sp. IT-79MI2]
MSARFFLCLQTIILRERNRHIYYDMLRVAHQFPSRSAHTFLLVNF